MEGTCLIGKQTVIRGTISGNEALKIEGRVEGNISLNNHLFIDTEGVVEAEIEAMDVTINGRLLGNIRAENRVVIRTGAEMIGDVSASQIVLEEGANFKGKIEMDVSLPNDVMT